MSNRLDGLLSLADVASDTPIGDPDEEGLAELRELGRGLTNGLFQSLRILAIHSSENEAVQEPLRRLVKVLDVLLTHWSSVHFITVEGQIYLNDLRIKMESSAYSNVLYLVGQLERHGIGGITFSRPLTQVEFKNFVTMLIRTKAPKTEEEDPLDHVREALVETGLTGISLDRPYYFKSGGTTSSSQGSEEGHQEAAALSYAKGVLAVKDYFRAVEAAEATNPLRIRKIVHDLVDVAENEPDNFLKLHTIHGVEDSYYNHCVNVATLAVSIGRELQLTRVELADLGAAAMFHDLGYSAIERQETEEDRVFSADDRMRLHTVAGFRSLLRQAEYGPGLLRRLLVTLEHHMTYKRPGGYPSLGGKQLSVFTRIVQVADSYDALVTSSDSTAGALPVKALERIAAGSGTIFDPVVVKALIQVVGRYPYGSLVKLTSGEIGVVTSGGRDKRRFARPKVMVVRSGDGSEVSPHEVDLGEKDILRRSILAVLDPADSDLTPHAVLFDKLDREDVVEADSSHSSLELERWNRAIWEGEDPDQLISVSVPEPGEQDEAVERASTMESSGSMELLGHQLEGQQADEPEEPKEQKPPSDEADVLAWLDATIASTRSAPVHTNARPEGQPSDGGDEGGSEVGAGEGAQETKDDPESNSEERASLELKPSVDIASEPILSRGDHASNPLPPIEPEPDDGLLVEAPPDTWDEEEAAEESSVPEPTPEERTRMLAKAFSEGGEAAVVELMERLGLNL